MIIKIIETKSDRWKKLENNEIKKYIYIIS